MGRFENRIAEKMKDPEFRAGYEDAQRELDVLPPPSVVTFDCPKCGSDLLPIPSAFSGLCESCGTYTRPETLDEVLEILAQVRHQDSNSPAFIAWWHHITKGYMTADEFLASL